MSENEVSVGLAKLKEQAGKLEKAREELERTASEFRPIAEKAIEKLRDEVSEMDKQIIALQEERTEKIATLHLLGGARLGQHEERENLKECFNSLLKKLSDEQVEHLENLLTELEDLVT